MRGRYRPSVVRAVVWSFRAQKEATRISIRELGSAPVSPPPKLSDDCRPYVVATLDRRNATCLVRSLVLQRWDLTHGTERDLVIRERPADAWSALLL